MRKCKKHKISECEERKEDVLHRARASSLRFSLSGVSARVLCLYWQLGSLHRNTLADLEPHRTGTVFSFISAAAAALCQRNPARILLRAHRIRPSVRCAACVCAVGGTPPRKSKTCFRRRASLSCSVLFRSGQDGKWPRSFMQLFRSIRPV